MFVCLPTNFDEEIKNILDVNCELHLTKDILVHSMVHRLG